MAFLFGCLWFGSVGCLLLLLVIFGPLVFCLSLGGFLLRGLGCLGTWFPSLAVTKTEEREQAQQIREEQTHTGQGQRTKYIGKTITPLSEQELLAFIPPFAGLRMRGRVRELR